MVGLVVGGDSEDEKEHEAGYLTVGGECVALSNLLSDTFVSPLP
jgi:hypothetical protein